MVLWWIAVGVLAFANAGYEWWAESKRRYDGFEFACPGCQAPCAAKSVVDAHGRNLDTTLHHFGVPCAWFKGSHTSAILAAHDQTIRRRNVEPNKPA